MVVICVVICEISVCVCSQNLYGKHIDFLALLMQVLLNTCVDDVKHCPVLRYSANIKFSGPLGLLGSYIILCSI